MDDDQEYVDIADALSEMQSIGMLDSLPTTDFLHSLTGSRDLFESTQFMTLLDLSMKVMTLRATPVVLDYEDIAVLFKKFPKVCRYDSVGNQSLTSPDFYENR